MNMKAIFLRTAHNYDTNAVSDETGLACGDKSLTHQSFKDECDINTIVERFGIGYKMPEGVVAPVYADFSDVDDFHSSLNAIARARESFDALPANIRYRFRNDPAQLVEFCSDDANRREAEDLGLVFRKPRASSVENDAADFINAAKVVSAPDKAP